jgi:hypothetical protein
MSTGSPAQDAGLLMALPAQAVATLRGVDADVVDPGERLAEH